jgi:cell wall-associated NlpC family hydrolase
VTPEPEPAASSPAGSIANGTVLGTTAFQHGVDEFRTAVTELRAQLTRTRAPQGLQAAAEGRGSTVGSSGTGTFGSSPSVANQLGAPARLRAQVAAQSTLAQGARSAASGFSSTLFGRGPQGEATMGQRAAYLGGRVARAGVEAVGSVVSGWGGGEKTYATALDAYSRQMMLSNQTQGQTGGTLARSYGYMAQRGGGQFWSNSASDMFGASLTINQQAYQASQPGLLNAASTMAMLNPGMGTQAAATMQGKFSTTNAYYAAQMMGLTPARGFGGTQDSGMATMNSLANRVNANIGGFQNLSQKSFAAEITTGGTLASSVAAYGNQIGLSGQEQQAIINQLKAENKLTSPTVKGLPGMTLEQAQKTLNTFSADPTSKAGRSAYATMEKYQLPIGSTLSEAQNVLQGKQANGYLASSATYLDAAKASANTLADINTLLQKVLAPFTGVIGAYQTGGIGGLLGYETGMGGDPGAPKSASLPYQRGVGRPTPSPKTPAKVTAKSPSGLGGNASSAAGGSQNAVASGAGGGAPTGNFSAALAWGEKHLGDPYVYGGEGPHVWDCSSFTQGAWRAGGISLPRTSQAQSGSGTPGVTVPVSEARPGDLVFYGTPGTASHVGLVTGADTVLEAPHTGDVVKFEKISQDPNWKFAKRVAGGIGSVTSTLGGGTPGAASATQGGIGSGSAGAAALGGSEVAALEAVLNGGGFSGGSSGGPSGSGSGADTAPTQGATAGASATGGGSLPSGVNTGGYTAAEKANVALGQQMAAAAGWTGTQFVDLFKLWNQESTWDANSVNKGSGAYGIPQALGHGHPFNLGDAKSQISWGLNYIRGRYGDPAGAWAHEQSNNWYSSGISEVVGDQLAHLHGGEMVLNANQARDARRSAAQGVRGGAGGAVSINFSAGAVVVQMPSATSDGAKTAAKSFVDFVAADDRIKTLMGGW